MLLGVAGPGDCHLPRTPGFREMRVNLKYAVEFAARDGLQYNLKFRLYVKNALSELSPWQITRPPFPKPRGASWSRKRCGSAAPACTTSRMSLLRFRTMPSPS